MATALAMEPALPDTWRRSIEHSVAPISVAWQNKALAAAANQVIVKQQLVRLSQGKLSRPGMSPLLALLVSQLRMRRQAVAYRYWLKRRH